MERMVELIGVDRKTVESMMGRLGGYDVSLDQPVGSESDSAPRGNFIPGKDANPEELVGEAEQGQADRANLRKAIATLPEREQLIIRRRHLADRPDTLQEVGEDLGISRERVRQLEVRALRRMREWLATEGYLRRVA